MSAPTTPEEADRICEAVLMLVRAVGDAATRPKSKPLPAERARLLTPADHAAVARREGLL